MFVMAVSELQRRLNTLFVAEQRLIQREQSVFVREEVLREALQANGPHRDDVAQWEQRIDRMVSEAAARLPPPVSIHAFVNALEDRAVELEVLHTSLERRAAALDEERRALACRMSAVVERETYLVRWAASMEESIRGLCDQEDALASEARRRDEGEGELFAWTQRLREKEDALANRERVVLAKAGEVHRREGHVFAGERSDAGASNERHVTQESMFTPQHSFAQSASTAFPFRYSARPLPSESIKESISHGYPHALSPQTAEEFFPRQS